MRNLFLQSIRNNVVVFSIFSIWSVIIYSNTFDAPFHYDDYVHIVNNPNIQWDKLSWENINRTLAYKESNLMRPVAYLSLALNYYFGYLNVRGYHYVNIAIHIITSFIFFLLLKSILSLPHFDRSIRDKNHKIAAIAAILWLSSPIQISAVTYIIQRMAALAALFYLSAIYFYLKGRISSGNKAYLFYILSLLSSLLALGSKENAITIPIFILLFEIIILRKGNIGFLFKKKIFIFLSILLIACFALLLYYYLITAVKPDKWVIYILERRFFTGVRAIVFYIIHLLFPIPSRLSIEHDFKWSISLFEPPSTLVILPILTGVIIYTLFCIKKHPLFSFFTLWFLGNLALETFHPYLITVFEHRLYLPSMGFFALAGIGIDNLFVFAKKKKLTWFLSSTILVIAVLFSINTYNRNNTWRDAYALWSDVVKKSPNIPIGYMQLGVTYFKDEDYNGALNNYLKARSIAPRDPSVRYGLGVIYFELKQYDSAIMEFNYVGSLGEVKPNMRSPSIGYYFSRIAKNYYGHGRVEDALQVLNNALLYEPNEAALKDLKEKMEKGTITTKEIMAK